MKKIIFMAFLLISGLSANCVLGYDKFDLKTYASSKYVIVSTVCIRGEVIMIGENGVPVQLFHDNWTISCDCKGKTKSYADTEK